MKIALGILAGVIFLSYSCYFARVLKGNAQEFEEGLLQLLGGWMVAAGAKSRRNLWLMLLMSAIIEIIYFGLTIIVINNPVMAFITGLAVGVECFHLVFTTWNFTRFFKGKTVLKDLLNWKMERISAVSFFTHTFLVLVLVISS